MPNAKTHRPRHEVEALERHAEAQAATDARRKGLSKPRRDDLARAAYYVLLSLYRDTNVDAGLRCALQRQVMTLMRHSQFDLIEANAAFIWDAGRVEGDLDAWFRRRWIEEGQRLSDGRGPYQSKRRKVISR